MNEQQVRILTKEQWLKDLERKYQARMGNTHGTIEEDIEEELHLNKGITKQETNLSILNIHWSSLGGALIACPVLLVAYKIVRRSSEK